MNNHSLPFLLCELANSHGGKIDVLEKLITEFSELDYPRKGIKFQIFSADSIALSDYPWYNVYKELEIPAESWSRLIKSASVYGDVFIDIFDIYGVTAFAENQTFIAGIKLQASVLDNNEVYAALATLDLQCISLILNISGYELIEIQRIVSRFHLLTDKIILQIGFQSYPTTIESTALNKIYSLKAEFPEYSYGIADHADGSTDFAEVVPIYANLLGCDCIEKHICIERDSAPYDGFSALEPNELKQLARRLQEVCLAIGSNFVKKEEREYLAKTLQIPLVRSTISAGTRIKPHHLLYRRTAQTGISWDEIEGLQQQRFLIKDNISSHQALNRDQFREARVGVIVAARLKSSRLKKKALLPIAGRASVERCLDQCLAVKGIEKVILATSNLDEDAVLSSHLSENRAAFWAGDPVDVISRYLGACDAFNLDVVIRVTGDCPLVSPEILEVLLDSHFQSGADYTAAAEAAVGTAGEIINVRALRTVINHFGRAEHSEYMTWYYQNNPDVFQLNIVNLDPALIRDYRLTLDHQEDLDLFNKILDEIGANEAKYGLDQIFSVLDNDPTLADINRKIPLTYKTDKNLINMLNEETRII